MLNNKRNRDEKSKVKNLDSVIKEREKPTLSIVVPSSVVDNAQVFLITLVKRTKILFSWSNSPNSGNIQNR